MPTRTRFLALLVFLLLPGVARAEEKPVPGTKGDDITAHIPAPAKSRPFHRALDFLRGGERIGRFGAEVKAVADGYEASERFLYDGQGETRVSAKARTDRHLFALGGSYERRNPQGFLEASFGNTKAASASRTVPVTWKTHEYENSQTLASAGATRYGLATLLYLVQVAPRREATYRWIDFHPDPPATGRYLADAVLVCHGRHDWQLDEAVHPAWIYSYTRGGRTYRMAHAASDDRFLGLEVVGLDLAMVPPGTRRVGIAESSRGRFATPVEQARRRAEKIRRGMPALARGWSYEGELLLGDYAIGRVRLEMQPTSHAGEPAWMVTERTVREAGAAKVVSELAAFLRPDLSLLRGESTSASPSGRSAYAYHRDGNFIAVADHARKKPLPPVRQPIRRDATIGLASVVAFLGHVPATRAEYVLSGFDPRFVATPKAGNGSFPQDVADTFIEVRGYARYSNGVRMYRTLAADITTRRGIRYKLHLDAKTRALVALVGTLPSYTIAPKGTPGKAVDFYATEARLPQSAYEAFIRFGRGYHLPRADYLREAFHWPTMLKHEIDAGHYAADTNLAAFRKDWVNEFLKRSKHRTLGDCDDLLMQILITSKETWGDDGSLTLTTLPVYGGHIYRIEPLDGRWYVTRVD